MAEIGYRLALEPVWPSLARHEVHRIDASLGRMLRFAQVAHLAPLSINSAGYASLDDAATQALGAAAYFPEVEAVIVPGARSPALHLVVFLGHVLAEEALTLRETHHVDWDAWRKSW